MLGVFGQKAVAGATAGAGAIKSTSCSGLRRDLLLGSTLAESVRAGQTGGSQALSKLVVLSALAGLLAVAWLTWTDHHLALEILRAKALGRLLALVGWLLVLVNLAALAWRIVLVMRYRPAPDRKDEELPSCTVVVPAYNEGRQVLKTLRSIATSDYPAGKLFIIAVDDGSKDDTWAWIQRGAAEFAGLILPLRQTVNGGKRSALHEGFKRAIGEVLVTIDSDSQVEPATLRNLLSPFVGSPEVGAVAGNVRVLNRERGLIPRMLEVSFAYSFDFIRASQSVLHTVMCTPGALSAYRRDAVMEMLPAWLQQRFCGRAANIGEDRAMTNLILGAGYHVHFQRSAVVYTNVPTQYRGLCKMFLRWARSNIRETLVMTGFAFRKFRRSSAIGARVNLVLHWLGMTAGQAMKLAVLGHLLWKPEVFSVRVLLGAAVTACVPAAFYAIRHRSTDALWAYLYGVFWLVGLSWIGLYAWLTPHKTGWLTRDLPGAVEGMPPGSRWIGAGAGQRNRLRRQNDSDVLSP